MSVIKKVLISISVLIVGAALLIGGAFYYFVLRGTRGAPLVLDQVQIWQVKTWKGNKYVLAKVIEGFHDKTESVVLFQGDVLYDQWGNPKYDNATYRGLIDQKWDKNDQPTRNSVKGLVEFETNRLRVIFDNGDEQKFDLSHSAKDPRYRVPAVEGGIATNTDDVP